MLPVNRLVLAFQNLIIGQVIQMPQLTKDRPYVVVGTRRVHGQYGPTVLFTLRSEDDDNINLIIYLPRRYAEVVADDDIDDINQGRRMYKLIYLGMSGPAYLLSLVL